MTSVEGAQSSKPRFTTNLQAVRFFAAYFIVLHHSAILLADRIPFALDFIPGVGFCIFFTISGYLLPAAWARNPRFRTYAVARSRRLFPAFFFVVLVTVFILGPCVTTLKLDAYFSHPLTWDYLLNLLLYPSYVLPGVFEGNYYQSVVNGSIWSLPPQLATYAIVPLIFLIKHRLFRSLIWVVIIGLTVANSYSGQLNETVIWGNNVSHAMNLIAFFAIGALIRELHLPLKLPVAIALFLLLIAGIALYPGPRIPVLMLTVPYITLTVSLRSWTGLKSCNKLPDISYGVFLVGFPVQQTLISSFPELHPAVSMLSTVAITTMVAILLERFVERPLSRPSPTRLITRTEDHESLTKVPQTKIV